MQINRVCVSEVALVFRLLKVGKYKVQASMHSSASRMESFGHSSLAVYWCNGVVVVVDVGKLGCWWLMEDIERRIYRESKVELVYAVLLMLLMLHQNWQEDLRSCRRLDMLSDLYINIYIYSCEMYAVFAVSAETTSGQRDYIEQCQQCIYIK